MICSTSLDRGRREVGAIDESEEEAEEEAEEEEEVVVELSLEVRVFVERVLSSEQMSNGIKHKMLSHSSKTKRVSHVVYSF